MQTIYQPKGAAQEYGEWALNIYQGCPHGCTYPCYVPQCLRRDRTEFHAKCEPRNEIIKETEKWLIKHSDSPKLDIFLCFTCDPFPYRYKHNATWDAISLLHKYGHSVTILTKGEIDLLSAVNNITELDTVGATISCGDRLATTWEPFAVPPSYRREHLKRIKEIFGCKTFYSHEPVIEPEYVYECLINDDFIDEFRIGKWNYNPQAKLIDWKRFGETCLELAAKYDRKVILKESLLKEMNK